MVQMKSFEIAGISKKSVLVYYVLYHVRYDTFLANVSVYFLIKLRVYFTPII